MAVNFLTWGTLQWTFYALGVGLLAGILGNIWATYFVNYKKELAQKTGKPIHWGREFWVITGCIVVVVAAIFGMIILS